MGDEEETASYSTPYDKGSAARTLTPRQRTNERHGGSALHVVIPSSPSGTLLALEVWTSSRDYVSGSNPGRDAKQHPDDFRSRPSIFDA